MAGTLTAVKARVADTAETKPGIFTTEFWLTSIGFVAGVVQEAVGVFNIHDVTVMKVQAFIVGVYAVSRGLAKQGQSYYPPFAPDVDPKTGLPTGATGAIITNESELEPGDLPDEGPTRPTAA
jgi:hypothetical protein